MLKTITIRLDEDTYTLIKRAAEGQRRSIANFVEYATVSYLAEEAFVSDSEMEEILADRELLGELRNAREDLAHKRFDVVR